MKRLFSIIGLLVLTSLPSFAQQTMVLTSLTANTASNIVAFPVIIDNFQVINSTTNIARVDFFDAATAVTNYAQAAYTSYTQYATNFNVVFTNQTGVLVTNTFAGLYTAPVANAGATNTRPLTFSAIVPASSTLNKDVKLQMLKGLTAIPNQSVTLVTTYRSTY